MITGETILTGADNPCPDCGKLVEFEVLQSPAGYYVGTQCDCGPYSRESIYFVTEGLCKIACMSIKREGIKSEYARGYQCLTQSQ
jgi:hypothetical protein